MSFVAVDLGASSSRHVSDSGQVSVTPNYMAFLPDGEISRIQPDAADLASCLEVDIVKTSGNQCDFFPANVMLGIMADRYTSEHDRPSVNQKKYLQKINYISAIIAAAVNRLTYDVAENIDLYLAVPPIEIHDAREAFASNLIGTYTVTFPKYMNGTSVNLNITSVQCYEESYMASTSFFFNMNGIQKEQNKKYLAGTVLSLDIGASTSDLAVIRNGRYLDRSGRTFRVGGNEARDILRNSISAKYDIELSIEDAEKVIAEGRLKRGNNYEDVSSLVVDAKSALAKKLINNMQTYFKALDIDMSQLNAIIVSGGGSMQSQYVNNDGEIIKTSEPMSYFVTQEITSLASGIDIVAYGDDARFANVKGLFIRAKMDSLKKTAQQQSQAQQQTQPVQQAAAQTQVQQPVQQTTQQEAVQQPVQQQQVTAQQVATPVQSTETTGQTIQEAVKQAEQNGEQVINIPINTVL